MNSSAKHSESTNLTAVIIAGGKGTRLGGKDKGLLEINGKALVSHIINQLSQQADKILINANRNLELYRQTGIPVIRDSLPDFSGPLAGILISMENVTTDYIITVPCDSPAIPSDYISRMHSTLIPASNGLKNDHGNDSKTDIAVAYDGERLQQMYMMIPTLLEDDLRQFLHKGGRAIKHWLAQHHVVPVDFSDQPSVFQNINTPDELYKYKTESTDEK